VDQHYIQDTKRAVEAKFEAQKIAFAPIAFQAARALRDLGILESVASSGEKGKTVAAVVEDVGLSAYGVETLLELGLSMELVKLTRDAFPFTYVLGKVGYFVLYDQMTRVNMDFVHDVCYKGAFSLEDAIRQGKPTGLRVFGEWKTIYHALSSLPEEVQKSWFAFDHYYSDNVFPEALKHVFKQGPQYLYDLGGNTAKWALACFAHSSEVQITIFDLPGQLEVARGKVLDAGAESRVGLRAIDILDPSQLLPAGADAIWMSQFLDCFSLEEIRAIMGKVRKAADPKCNVWILEPFWDRQRFIAGSYALHATSLYFTCMANGNSKMYRSDVLIGTVEQAGLSLQESIDGLGANSYSLLRFRTR
jgi:hypothetical protein